MSRREKSGSEIKAGFNKSKQAFVNQSLPLNLQLGHFQLYFLLLLASQICVYAADRPAFVHPRAW